MTDQINNAAAGLDQRLQRQVAKPLATRLLIGINLLVFVVMVAGSAGFWQSPSDVQLAWGANFGPATQDGEWWRLASAMFIHFGVLHLALNMWALWDGGSLVERMYGHLRFTGIYFASGLTGNLLSLVVQGNEAVSGGASGAIFGVFGALLVFLWRERHDLHIEEFRWLFWGALAFSAVSMVLGFVIPGIDNSAHIGGFVTGILSGTALLRPLRNHARSMPQRYLPQRYRLIAAALLASAVAVMITRIPLPKYRWSEEVQVREQIAEFLREEQTINRSWLNIREESKQGDATFDELAGHIDSAIGDRYEGSFEQLSQLPLDPALPSAPALENILQYVQHRRDASRALADELRARPDAAITPEDAARLPVEPATERAAGPDRPTPANGD